MSLACDCCHRSFIHAPVSLLHDYSFCSVIHVPEKKSIHLISPELSKLCSHSGSPIPGPCADHENLPDHSKSFWVPPPLRNRFSKLLPSSYSSGNKGRGEVHAQGWCRCRLVLRRLMPAKPRLIPFPRLFLLQNQQTTFLSAFFSALGFLPNPSQSPTA